MDRRLFLRALFALPAALVALPSEALRIVTRPWEAKPAATNAETKRAAEEVARVYELVPYSLAFTVQHEALEYDEYGLLRGLITHERVRTRLVSAGYSPEQICRLATKWSRAQRRE